MYPLELAKIISHIDYKYRNNLTPEYFAILSQTNSTNTYLARNAKLANNKLRFCIADQQINGRGRLNRTWNSPAGNIYLSILFNFHTSIHNLAGLNISTALAVFQALQDSVVLPELKLKWPNDILYQQHKLAGILIENNYNVARNTNTVIVGIGINVLTNQKYPSNKLQQSISLQQILNYIPDRNILIGKIISTILKKVDAFQTIGLTAEDVAAWQAKNYALNQLIIVKLNNQTIAGINKGIAKDGKLLLDLNQDNLVTKDKICKLKIINSGEIIAALE